MQFYCFQLTQQMSGLSMASPVMTQHGMQPMSSSPFQPNSTTQAVGQTLANNLWQ